MGCRPGAIQFIFHVFGDCVYDDRDLIGFCVGVCSIVFWMFAQIPQLYKNYQNKSSEALSAWFLAEWLGGDTFNLVGSLLKGDQPQSVVLTAQYFVLMDCVMLVQYLYYTAWQRLLSRERVFHLRRHRRHRHHHHPHAVAHSGSTSARAGSVGHHPAQQPGQEHQQHEQPEIRAASPSSRDVSFRPQRAALVPLAAALVVLAQAPRLQQLGQAGQSASRRLLASNSPGLGQIADGMPTWAHTAGAVLGYASCLLYLTSRVSQIYRNWRRQSVEGLAMSMFFFAVAANTFYGASIVIRTYTLQQLNSSLPWLLGSLGTVVLDFTILMQARVLGTDKKHQSDEEESLLPVISADDKPSGYAAL